MMVLRNVLLTILVNFVYIQAQATLDDAAQALEELDALSLEIQGSVHLLMNEQADIMRAQLTTQREQAIQEIDAQILNITYKIQTMADQVRAAADRPVDICLSSSVGDLQDFGDEWKSRIAECTGYILMTGNDLLYTAWSRLWYEYDIDYYCSQLVFNECEQLQGGECPDAVMSAIENARGSMNRSAELFWTEMSIQIVGLYSPCTDMVNQALAIYPPLVLDFAKTCLDEIVTSSYSFSC